MQLLCASIHFIVGKSSIELSLNSVFRICQINQLYVFQKSSIVGNIIPGLLYPSTANLGSAFHALYHLKIVGV